MLTHENQPSIPETSFQSLGHERLTWLGLGLGLGLGLRLGLGLGLGLGLVGRPREVDRVLERGGDLEVRDQDLELLADARLELAEEVAQARTAAELVHAQLAERAARLVGVRVRARVRS